MSKRGIDAPLAVQMDRLKKTLNRRDQRRDKDRQQRLVSLSKDDPYAQNSNVKPEEDAMRSGDAAQAAVMNAAALEGPAEIRCELCQATFRNEAMLRQHEEGPAHKKALAREKAQKERDAWLENPSAASNALQAAAWTGGPAKQKYQSARVVRPVGQSPSEKSNQGHKNQPETPAPVVVAQGMSHADRIAQAHKTEEPLNINGWMPPVLSMAEIETEAEPRPSRSTEAQNALSNSQSSSDMEGSDDEGGTGRDGGELNVKDESAQDEGADVSGNSNDKEPTGEGLGLGLEYDDSDESESNDEEGAPITSFF